MKLAQRIVLKYYQIKFKAIERVSQPRAAKAAFELFCTPYTRQKRYAIPPVFQQAEARSFVFQEHSINGFCWKPAVWNQQKILICHGFDSNSYKFEKYIEPLLDKGFEILAFDAPAHGTSSGKTINALLYSEMIEEIDKSYGPINTIIAHSFGGIAATLAIERMKKHAIKRLVLAAPATETTRSLNDFCRYLHISDKLKKNMEKIIIATGGHPAEWFSVARIIQTITIPTLWIHDKNDPITPYADMEFLTRLHLPCVQFLVTENLGHSLYRDDAVAKSVISFISSSKD